MASFYSKIFHWLQISLLTFITLFSYRPARTLRLSEVTTSKFQVPYINTELVNVLSFSCCSRKIGDVIPAIITASATVATFKRRLKSHFP